MTYARKKETIVIGAPGALCDDCAEHDAGRDFQRCDGCDNDSQGEP